MRWLVLPAVLSLGAAALLAVVGQRSATELSAPSALELGDAVQLLAEGRTPTVAQLETRSFSVWGGQYFTAAGEPVTIRISDTYPRDDALAQQWATFLGNLMHGAEITSVTLTLAPQDEVQEICGIRALACYSPPNGVIVAPGNDPDHALSAESIVAHEYGHHVAANRSNEPWVAGDYGTKRWASYEQVCRDARVMLVHPGAEDHRYELNPGEGFAEAYRVLNERRLGLPESAWEIVSEIFYPDTAALVALERDIVTPWAAGAVVHSAGSFSSRTKRIRTTTWPTALDGEVAVTFRVPATLRARIELMAGTKRVGTATVAGGGKVIRTTACGTRTLSARVTRLAGSGRYTLAVSRP